MTCSSFLGCSSTLAARNNVVWEIICGQNGGEAVYRRRQPVVNSPSQHCGGTYVSMEFGEGVDHIKPVHINYSGVYNQLRAGCAVKAQHMRDFTVNRKPTGLNVIECGTRFSFELAPSGQLAKKKTCIL